MLVMRIYHNWFIVSVLDGRTNVTLEFRNVNQKQTKPFPMVGLSVNQLNTCIAQIWTCLFVSGKIDP